MYSIEISYIIASQKPRELAEFYSNVSDTSISEGISSTHFVISKSHEFKIQIYCPSKNRLFLHRGMNTAVCFHRKSNLDLLEVLTEWSESLILLGAKVLEVPKLESFGAEAWMLDPDLNPFLIIVSHI